MRITMEKYFDTVIAKKFENQKRYGEIVKTYKNSQKISAFYLLYELSKSHFHHTRLIIE